MNKLSILVVDDHNLFREGFCKLLRGLSNINKVYEACNGYEFLKMLNSKRTFDIIFMDISMPKLDGLQATLRATKSNSSLKIIALSMHKERRNFENMMNAGCKGYLPKTSNFNEIKLAIETVMNGKLYTPSIFQEARKTATTDGINEYFLSPREKEVIKLLTKGHTSKEISGILNISKKTIDKHRQNIFTKVGVTSTVSLVVFAIKNNFVDIS